MLQIIHYIIVTFKSFSSSATLAGNSASALYPAGQNSSIAPIHGSSKKNASSGLAETETIDEDEITTATAANNDDVFIL